VSEVNDPVVVALLRHRIKYEPGVAAEAVIELTRAGRLRVENEDGDGDFVAVRVAPEPGSAPTGQERPAADRVVLEPGSAADDWQRTVLERLASRALPGGVPTPLSVLTTVDGGDYWDWRLAFEAALLGQAERAGLIERRLGTRQTMAVVCGLTLGAATAVGAAVAVLFRPSPGFGAALATALFGFIVLSVTVGRLSDWRLTESGRRTVQRAEAASAAGEESPRSMEDAVRGGIAPLRSDHVWSGFGGAWRVVGLGSRFGDTRRLPKQVRDALPERRVLRCQVVKHWSVPGGRERDPAYCCAFDDGASTFTWSFAMPERTWHALSVGDVVSLDFSPRRHKLFAVGPLPDPSAGHSFEV